MQYTEYIDNKSILGIIRRSCSYVDSRLIDHGYRVAFLVSLIARQYHESDEKGLRDICFLSLLHDIGAYKTDEITRLLHFETSNVFNHSVYGYLFIKYFSPLRRLSKAVLYHHVPWNRLAQTSLVLGDSGDTPDGIYTLAQIIQVADRIDVAVSTEHRSWAEAISIIRNGKGIRFSPQIAEIAEALPPVVSIEDACKNDARFHHILSDVPFTPDEIAGYLSMLIFTIDFRSRHTVTHTITTTSISYELAKLAGADENTCNQIVCGALLHDLGKIGIPVEILEYPGKLSPQAMTVMRTHVDITEKIFGGEIDETITRLAIRHHEKLDGSGYPHGLTTADLTSGERIVAIADIVSALAGTRSYKDSFPKEKILSILTQMTKDGLLDPSIVALMVNNFDTVMEETRIRCQPILGLYEEIQTEYESLSEIRMP